MTSHSEAPNRGKCMPARALRYCPVMVQVHSLWMPLNVFILYMRRAPLSPREGYRPGEAAVQRMKRQPSNEVTTIGDPADDKRVKGQAPNDLVQRRHPEIFAGKFSFSGGYQDAGDTRRSRR